LADFGLCAHVRVHPNYDLQEKMGTLVFMAPEQANAKTYRKKIDIWACGIIMYMLLEGRHPLNHKGQSIDDFMKRLANPTFEFSPHVSAIAKDLFFKLCNPQAMYRYTASRALRHPWITRELGGEIPLTEVEEIREVEAENKLK